MIFKGTVIVVVGLFGMNTAWGQWDDMVHVPSHVEQRIADDIRIGPSISEHDQHGVQLPTGTYQVDLINGRGRVVRSYQAGTIQELELGLLKPGTWTLRARTSESYLVRRFMIIRRGTVMWSQPRSPGRN